MFGNDSDDSELILTEVDVSYSRYWRVICAVKITVAIEPAITISNQAARNARGPLTVCGKPWIDELRKNAFHNLCRAFPGLR